MAQRKRVARSRGGRRAPAPAATAAAPLALPDARWALLPALLAGLVYLNALHNPFVYDDANTVVGNPSIRDLHNWKWVLVYSPFRPVVNVSYALDAALWGIQPLGFHVTSLLLHGLVAALLFAFARDLVADQAARRGAPADAGDRAVPIIAACVFAVHPLLTEAVGYASARPELLCSVFTFGALMLARRAVLGRPRFWIAAGVCWALAAASRETGAVVPILLLAWDRLLGPGEPVARRRRLWLLHLPLVVMIVAGAAVRVEVYLRQEAGALPRSVWQHVCTELPIFWRYLGLLLWPAGQSLVPPAQRVASALDGRVLLAAAGMIAVGIGCWMLRRRQPIVVLGLIWFPLLLAPSSLIVPLVELMAEHRAYLASAGIFLAAAVGLGALVSWWQRAGRQPRRLPAVALALLVALLALLTLKRNEVWNDEISLWADASAKAPRTWAPYYGLANALRNRGDCAHAIPVYKRAAALLPEDSHARLNLATCLAQQGRLEEARLELHALLAIDPTSAAAHNDLGMIALSERNPNEATHEFQRALGLDPRNVEARLNLAMIYEGVMQQPQLALQMCEEIERIKPGISGVGECIQRNRRRLGG